jgi:hypothetical protein
VLCGVTNIPPVPSRFYTYCDITYITTEVSEVTREVTSETLLAVNTSAVLATFLLEGPFVALVIMQVDCKCCLMCHIHLQFRHQCE